MYAHFLKSVRTLFEKCLFLLTNPSTFSFFLYTFFGCTHTRFECTSTRFGWIRRGLAATWVQMASRTLPGGSQAGLQGTYFYSAAGSDLSEILCMSSNASKCLAKLGRPAERTVTNVKSIARNAHSYRDLADAFDFAPASYSADFRKRSIGFFTSCAKARFTQLQVVTLTFENC